MNLSRAGFGVLWLGLLSLFMAACAPVSTRDPAGDPSLGRRAASLATEYVGTPYRYGGASPAGFDCSGLVYYSYRQVGVMLPRTVADLYRLAKPVRLVDASPGDLLFFRFGARDISHVGMVTEKGRFVHAPQGGKTVTLARLDDPYWRKRLLSVGRVY